MADINELFSALQKADAAGNKEDAKQLANMIRQIGGYGGPREPEVEPDTGFTGAIKGSAKQLQADFERLKGRAGFKDVKLAEQEAQKLEAEGEKVFKPTTEGWTESPWQKLKETAGGSLPYMLAPVAAGGAAALGGAPIAVGTGLAGLASGLQFTGSNLSRQQQADENLQLQDTSLIKAAAAAIPQAALDVVGLRYIPGIQKLFKSVGQPITEKAAREMLEQGTLRTAGQYIAGGAKIGGIEGATEAGQQFFERLQAGLSIADEDARKEYLENFIGGAALGAVASPFGVRGKRNEARGAIAKAEQEQAAQAQAAQEEQDKQLEFEKQQKATGNLFGEVTGEASALPNVPSTLTVAEREAQAGQQKQTAESERDNLITEANAYKADLEAIEKQRDEAASKGDYKAFGALDAQAKSLEENNKGLQERLKADASILKVDNKYTTLTPEMEMAKLRGEQKSLTKQLQNLTGPTYDPKKAASIVEKLTVIDKRMADVSPGAAQLDLFDSAQMGAEDRAFKQQQKDARAQEQTDLFEATKGETKQEVLNKEAIDAYQKGLQDLEDAYAAGADERITAQLITQLQKVAKEKELTRARNAVGGEELEKAKLSADRLKRSIAEEKTNLENASSEEEAAQINATIDALTKRLAITETARADNAEEIESQAAARQREALNRAVENVRSILSGDFFNSFNPEAASQLKSGIEEEIRKAGADYTAAAIDEINAARGILGSTQRQGSTERIGGQKALTNDEALKMATAIRSRFDFLAYDPTYLAEKVRDKNLKILTDALRRIKEQFLQGPSKVQKVEEPFELTSPGDMPKRMRLEAVNKKIKEVAPGARTDYVALINTYQTRLDKIEKDTENGPRTMAMARRVERLKRVLNTLRERVGRYYTEAGELPRTKIIADLNAVKREIKAMEDAVEEPVTGVSEVKKVGEYKNKEGKKVPVYQTTKEQPLSVREKEAGVKLAPKEGGIEEQQGELFPETLATLRANATNFMNLLRVKRRTLTGETLKRVQEKERLAKIDEEYKRLDALTKDLEQFNLELETQKVKLVPELTSADKAKFPVGHFKKKNASIKAQNAPVLKEIARLENEKARTLKQMNALDPEATRPLTEAEVAARKTDDLVGRLTKRLEVSFNSSKEIAQSRSEALHKMFKQPEIDRVTGELATAQMDLKYYTKHVEWLEKTYGTGKTKEAKFVRKNQIPAEKAYIGELNTEIENLSYWLDSLTTRETEYFVAANEGTNRSIRMTRKLLAEALDNGSITPEQSRVGTKKVDDIENANEAEVEKRVGDLRKAEQERVKKLGELPVVRSERVASSLVAKTDELADINAKIKAAQKEQSKFDPNSEDYKSLQRDIGVLKERRAPMLEPMQRVKFTEDIVPQTEEQKREAKRAAAADEAAERIATRKENEARVAQGLTQPKEETEKANIEANRGINKLAAKPPREERKKDLKVGPTKDKPEARERVKKDFEKDAYSAGISSEDYELVRQGMIFGFKARIEPSDKRVQMSRESVNEVLSGIKLPKGLNIKVLAILPEGLKQYIRARGYNPDSIKGFVTANGQVVVVANNHSNAKEVEKTVAHEVTGHMGVEAVLGEAGMKSLTNKIVNQMGGVMKLANELGVGEDAYGAYTAAKESGKTEEEAKAAAVSEMIAHVAETRPTKNFMAKANEFVKALVGALRAGLRRIGLDLDISTSDIYKLLRDAREDFKVAPGAYKTSTGDIQFSGKPKYNSKFADLGGDIDSIVSGQQNMVSRIKASATGMKAPKDMLKPGGILSEANRLAFRTRYIDRFAPVEKIASKVAEKFKDSLKGTQLMYYMRMHDQLLNWVAQIASGGPVDLVEKKRSDGKIERIIESKNSASLKQVAEALKDADVGDAQAANTLFTFYLAAKRAERVGLKTLNFGPNVTEAKLKKVLDRINSDKKTKDAFDKAAKVYNEYNKGLVTFAVKTGSLSKETAQILLETEDYIPFYRVDKGTDDVLLETGGSTPIRIGNIKDQPYLQELVGGDTAILDVFTSALQNTKMLTDMAMRNLATRNVAFSLQELGLLKIKKNRKGEEFGSGIYPETGPASDKTIRFKIDGVDHHAIVDTDTIGIPAELLVQGMEGVKTSIPNLVRVAGVPAKLLRSYITRNPAYAIRQIARDSLSNAFTTGANSVPILDNLKQLGSMWGGNNAVENTLKQRGILGGQVIGGAPDAMQKAMLQIVEGKPGWEKAMAYLDHLSIMGDATSRVTSYNSFVKQGLSDMEATLATLEAMNFNKRGTSPSMYLLNQMVPFLNAQIQGLDVLYKAFSGKMPFAEKLAIKQKILARGALMAGMTMAYTAMSYDDDDYKNATTQQRIGNWLIKLPGIDEKVKVPIPFEVGGIFKMLPEMIYSTAFKDKKLEDAAKEIADYSRDQFIPSVTPTLLKPFIELPTNHSFFTGKPIESARLQQLEPGQRANNLTPEALKALGEVTNVSPVMMEYLLRNFTGSMPLALLSLANPILSKTGEAPEGRGPVSSTTPIVGAFFQPKDANGLIDKAYEEMSSVIEAKQTYNNLVDSGRDKAAEEYLTKKADLIGMATQAGTFRQKMGDLAKQEREVRAMTGVSGKEKREMLDMIKQEKILLSKDLISARE